jgi:hypothetical protein
MATNFHSELTNDQLHNPKDFSIARKNSVTTKDSSNNLKWAKANYTTVSTVTCQADVAGSLHLQYLCFYSTNDSNKYAVYFQITGLDILPIPTGYTGVIAVDLTASGINSTAAQVGDALQVALNAQPNFTATDNNAGVVTVSGMTTATNPDSGSTSFDMVNIDTEVGDEFLQTDSSGNIKWGTAPGGGGGCSNVFSTITTSPVSETVSASGCTDNLVISQMENTRITGTAAADTIQIEAIENITFRGDTTSGLEAGTEYVFDNGNTRGNRFLTAMTGTSLAPSAILKAAVATPAPVGKVVSFHGVGSANGTGEFYISLWKFPVECSATVEGNVDGELVATIKVNTAGNATTMCWNAPITPLTYGGYDMLVPSFRWTESTLSSARVVAKLRII